MDAAEQLAILTAYVEAHPPAPTPVLTSAQIAAEDYWESVAEARHDERHLPMSESDERHRQESYDNWIEGCS